MYFLPSACLPADFWNRCTMFRAVFMVSSTFSAVLDIVMFLSTEKYTHYPLIFPVRRIFSSTSGNCYRFWRILFPAPH